MAENMRQTANKERRCLEEDEAASTVVAGYVSRSAAACRPLFLISPPQDGDCLPRCLAEHAAFFNGDGDCCGERPTQEIVDLIRKELVDESRATQLAELRRKPPAPIPADRTDGPDPMGFTHVSSRKRGPVRDSDLVARQWAMTREVHAIDRQHAAMLKRGIPMDARHVQAFANTRNCHVQVRRIKVHPTPHPLTPALPPCSRYMSQASTCGGTSHANSPSQCPLLVRSISLSLAPVFHQVRSLICVVKSSDFGAELDPVDFWPMNSGSGRSSSCGPGDSDSRAPTIVLVQEVRNERLSHFQVQIPLRTDGGGG